MRRAVERPARAAALPAQGQARHLPVPARRALATRSVRLQAEPGEAARHGTAGLDSHGPAPHRHDGVPDEVPHRAFDLQVRAATANRASSSANCCPYTAKIADDICVDQSLQTDAINHDPAVTFFQTGFQIAGRPSIGAWISYGLGSENQDLPAFVVMVSQGGGNSQALADRQWGSGFLPTKYQGVKFRSGADPVLYLSNPPGYSRRCAAAFSGRSGKAERHEAASSIRIRRSRRASRSTKWRTGCRPPCPS